MSAPQHPRLLVELNQRTVDDLAWLVNSEGLNKTTLVNRSLQVYKHVLELQRRGGTVLLEDPTKDHQERLVLT